MAQNTQELYRKMRYSGSQKGLPHVFSSVWWECYGSATAEKTFDRYGKSDKCEGDGKGGTWANRVYAFQGLSLNLFTYFHSVS